MLKRIIMLIIIASSIFAQTAVAPDAGDGSEANPYQIATLENLYWISADSINWDKHYIQTADINATDTENWFDGKGWLPIAYSAENYFTGFYDGQNYVIYDLFINRKTESKLGLFSVTSDAVIENLFLTDINYTGNGFIGGVVGFNGGTTINKCHISGAIRAVVYDISSNDRVNIGGVAGISCDGKITNCINSATIKAKTYVGGLIGYSHDDIIEKCYCNGRVEGASAIGGLVGYNGSNIYQCGNTATVIADNAGGGIYGMNELRNEYNIVNIFECYNIGDISAANAGGIAGYVQYANIKNCYNTGKISGSGSGGVIGELFFYSSIMNCYNNGLMSGIAGGLIGSNDYDQQVDNCYWDIETSGQTQSAGGMGKTTLEMKSLSTFSDSSWNFNEIWAIDTNGEINNGYIYLIWETDSFLSNITPTNICFVLNQNHPNPFNPTTTISYQLSAISDVELAIYDLSGRKIKQWSYQNQNAGAYEFTWNSKDHNGNPVPSGVYIYSMKAGEFIESKKMLLLK